MLTVAFVLIPPSSGAS